jgi:hypothetical protein
MINNKAKVQPLIHLEEMLICDKKPLLPAITKLVGFYMILPSKLERLLALVLFMKAQDELFDAAVLTKIVKKLNLAIKHDPLDSNFVNPYDITFAKVTTLIGDHKNELLIEAAEEGNTLAVSQLLRVPGIDVNAKDKGGKKREQREHRHTITQKGRHRCEC